METLVCVHTKVILLLLYFFFGPLVMNFCLKKEINTLISCSSSGTDKVLKTNISELFKCIILHGIKFQLEILIRHTNRLNFLSVSLTFLASVFLFLHSKGFYSLLFQEGNPLPQVNQCPQEFS